MMDEMYGIYEPPKMDKKRGIVYFSCPEWADCEECMTNCPFNCTIKPDPADLMDYGDVEIPQKLWVPDQGKVRPWSEKEHKKAPTPAEIAKAEKEITRLEEAYHGPEERRYRQRKEVLGEAV